ncbi:GEVED domain-containing protein [Mesonia sp. K7]|uniref:Ig-like domain-containing protein n=1 Tax=Mesonia sp. K7 TaxID=2218606 RepID=UPI000DA76ECB|nr:GEVED domain-containing protein [Mesonia sp. K7]PZD78623.1 hypothetical protein DNG35_03965 [Mesonia sp. K7]
MKKNYMLSFILACFTMVFGFSQNCSTLAITNTVDGSVCGPGKVVLEATSSGTGDDIVWFDAATGGNYVGSGNVFETAVLTSTTQYWATEVLYSGTPIIGDAETVFTAGASNNLSAIGSTVTFAVENTNSNSITITGLDNYMPANVTREHELWYHATDLTGPPSAINASNGWVLATPAQTSTSGASIGLSNIFNNTSIVIPGNTVYRFALVMTANTSGVSTFYYWGNTTTPAAPNNFSSNGVSLLVGDNKLGGTDNVGYSGPSTNPTANNPRAFYGKIYFDSVAIQCESTPRMQATATVNTAGDELVTSLPYTDTDDTANYANNYTGAPGNDCGTADMYLDGNEVVYEYTATADYIMTAELANITANETSIFVYESCADIGTDCYAGAVNENTGTYDLQFSVVNGQTYYIVVSSSAVTGTFPYTFNLDGVLCTNYPAPTGSATQDFIAGQTLASLDVTGSDLTWYSDAALTTVIQDDTVMVDNTPYYVTQSFGTCESPALTITVNEVQCSVLSIVSSQGASVCGEGVVELQATGAEQAVDTRIWWYENATGGTPIGKGATFTTPEIATTTSFWVSEVAATGSVLTGQGQPTSSGTLSTTTNGGIILDVTQQMTLIDAEVFSTSAAGGILNVELRDINNGNATVASASATMPAGGTSAAPISVVVSLNFNIAPGQYRLVKVSGPTFRYESGSFPDPLGTYGSVTGGATATGTSTLQYIFYNLTIGDEQAICSSSPRTEVIATVNNAADIVTTNPLPYVNTNSTGAFANNYAGDPGNNCNTTDDYLDGSDVVYEYVADTDRVVKIGLSAITGNDASVFVYENCSEIGNSCLAGAVNTGSSSDFAIDEFTVYAGESYFIVVSGNGTPMSIDYTLTIEEAMINCADYTTGPTVDDPEYFNPGDTLGDLDIEGANLTFYSDAAGTMMLQNTDPAVDGATYYVTQTLNGCVSNIVAVNAEEIICNILDITSSMGDTVPCVGSATLTATPSGNGNEIYWYDAQTGGNLVGSGPTYTTPQITSTTSYWASEVLVDNGGSGGGSGCADQLQTTFATGSSCGAGNMFDLVINNSMLIEGFTILPNATSSSFPVDIYYVEGGFTGTTQADWTLVESLSVNATSGQQLQFNLTNGVLLDAGKTYGIYILANLRYTPSANTFSNADLTFNSGNGNCSAFDYCCSPRTWNGIIHYDLCGGNTIICESPREEVIATVDTNGDIQVTTLPYTDANNNTLNYGDPYEGTPGTNCGTTENYLNGNDVVYKFTAPNTELVDIQLSDLTDFYGAVFVYDSCGDLLDNCLAGAVAGPSDDDFGIEDFQVTAGEDYYIVVSSWLTPTIGYTLDIIPFDCAALAAPDGDSPQDFVGGDTLADLEVDTTENGATLNWYAGPGATNPIPDTTTLMDNTTYFVTQTFNGCESTPTSILVEEIDCSSLGITATTTGTVSCQGEVTMTATGSGTGSGIYWYDAPVDGNVVATGNTFTSPTLTTTTSYWVSEINLVSGSVGGSVPSGYCIPTYGTGCTSGDVLEDFVMLDAGINHVGSGCSPSGYGDFTNDPSLVGTLSVGQSYDFSTVHGPTFSQGIKIWIDLDRDGAFNDTNELLYTSSGTALAHTGSITIPATTGGPTVMRIVDRYAGTPTNACTPGSTFGETHDYKVVIGEVLCESTPRTEVVATVNQTGDVQVSHTDLPYNTSDSTAIYGDNFEGDPGSDCPGAAYLDGNEVVYQYTADPVNDDILQIELSGITNPNTGMYIYTSCGEVGTNCLTGVTNEDSPSAMAISDYYINAGETIFIVISSEAATVNYTLDIYGFDCAAAPLVEVDPAPYFVQPDVLDDITVETDPNSTSYTWYADAALTMPIADPTIEDLVDGTTYYVTQTILGCESAAVAVTVVEFDCNAMGVSQADDIIICAPGGEVTLNAQTNGVGNEVIWYDAATGGSVLGTGNSLDVNVSSTTSYWVAEVFTDGTVPVPGSARLAPDPGSSDFGGYYGLEFVAYQSFTLASVEIYPDGEAGTFNLQLVDDLTDQVLITTPVTVPNMDGATPFVVTLNYNITPGTYRLMQDGNIDMTRDFASTTTYPYPIGANSIYGEVTTGQFGATGSNTTSYYYFYNWTIGSADILCESTREEVVVTVNDQPTAVPTGTSIQKLCTGATIADLTATGSDLQWYASDTASTPLGLNHELEDGETYYVTQTIDACESQTRLAVTVEIKDVAALPTGPTNQDFVQGETILDLTVTGTNLTWYTSNDGMIFTEVTDPSQVNLTDQTTYYVTQTPNGFCESDKLPIKVHRVVGLDHPNFEGLVYYPNPVRDYLSIANRKAIDEIVVFNLLGQQVVSEKLNTTEAIIDMSYLAAGPYMVKITVEDRSTMVKVMKE